MKPLTALISVFTMLAAVFSAYAQAPQVPDSIVFGGEIVRFDNDDLRERMDRELIAFTYTHSTSTLMLKRSGKIFPVVEPILRRMGMPDDLKYLMVIESNLDPQAVSPAGAAGLWQFMSVTAREYGLEVNTNVDERYNTEKATEAACKYLRKAHDRMGDWMSVAASYNAGPTAISSRLESQHADTALELWLNSETARYMFRALAAKMLFENPGAFGFNIPAGERYPYREPKEVFATSEPVPDLVKFAEEHGVTYAMLKKANPWLRESSLKNSTHKTYFITIPSND
ncbi:MAG: lytic transglycosylase domain-containing protein [Bacteroidales bacterium]|nr:lytic transglycosylase domain-containing protein [Bacteroidales bacterium]